MTNAEIILGAMMLAELDPETVEVDTFAGWKRRGYTVKRGEKATFQTKIWKPSKYSKKELEDIEEQKGIEVADKAKDQRKLVLVNAHFFTDTQVEKLKKEEER